MNLREACDAVIADPSLLPQKDAAGRIVTTHCNQGARRVAQALGCHAFDDLNLTAEAMVQIMAGDGGRSWIPLAGQSAAAAAQAGRLVFACMSAKRLGEPHAHIAAVYPAPMGRSGSLDRDVPFCANVGVKDCEELVTAAFPVHLGEPEYFGWIG